MAPPRVKGSASEKPESNLAHWQEEAKRSTTTEFATLHHGQFFLLYRPLGEFTFETVTGEGNLEEAVQSGRCEIHVIPVQKSSFGPRQDRISIGRARDCDIVIGHPSISKMHAYICTQNDGGITITDLGSRNGTQVGDRILIPHIAEPLHPDDIVIFGTHAARVLDAKGLHEALLRLR